MSAGDVTIPILYQDEDILVIDKPAGVTVNRAQTTHGEVTIQDWAEKTIGITYDDSKAEAYKEGEYDVRGDFYRRGGIVHRLDKETSGVLILAKNEDAFVGLLEEFKLRVVKKTYIALSHGKIMPSKGEINVPVGRLPWNRQRFGIMPSGRDSETFYTVLGYYRNPKTREILSLVELFPQSGRTHQIRVHLKYLGFPIVSDALYGGRKTQRSDRKMLSRLFLHAAKISFTHPINNAILFFESPLPSDLDFFLRSLTKVEDA